METNIARTFAALNATNEAILYAKSPEELYEKVCEAAFSSGDFLAATIFLLEPETDLLRFAAGFGEEPSGCAASTFRSSPTRRKAPASAGRPFATEGLHQQRFPQRCAFAGLATGRRAGQVGAAAAMPLTCNGRSVGVFLVTRREAGSLDGQIVALLERMSANISFALDNFDHEAARKDGERAMRRLNRMFGAISATNEAILRAKTEQELYQRVCDAAVHSGKSIATVVLLAEPGSIWLKPRRGHRRKRRSDHADTLLDRSGQRLWQGRLPARHSGPSGLASTTTSARPQAVHGSRPDARPASSPASRVPLIKAGKSVGVVMFFVGKSWAADEEIIALLARIAENVSFALDNFERADEKAKADEQKERLTRMFAALSATNEAIMRAKSRTEMFELVCEAAARADSSIRRASCWPGPTANTFDMVAVGRADRGQAAG